MKYFNNRSYRDCMMIEVEKMIKNIEKPATKKQNLFLIYCKNLINKIKKFVKNIKLLF